MKNSAPINEDDLHAWADNRLDAARRAEVDAWLASHSEAMAAATAWREQSAALHRVFDPVLGEPVPSRLVNAVRGDNSSLAQSFPRAMAASVAWLALGIVIGYAARGVFQGSDGGLVLARNAAVAHAVYVPEVRHPVEVPAEQEAHLVAWLSKRLGRSLKVPDLNEAGYALVGGRLLPGDRDNSGAGPVAQFMYQSASGQRMTLYLRRNDSGRNDAGFSYAREGKVDVLYWIDDGMGCAVSGEVGKQELMHVATLVYHQFGFDDKPLNTPNGW
jgi:anti-sigma factor RsiW